MLWWRRRRIVFCRLLDDVAVGLVGCRIEQAPAFDRGRRRFAAEHGFAVFELGRRTRLRRRAHRLGTVRFLLVIQFLLVLGVGGGEKGYQFGGREGAMCGVTLWPPMGAEIGKKLTASSLRPDCPRF